MSQCRRPAQSPAPQSIIGAADRLELLVRRICVDVLAALIHDDLGNRRLVLIITVFKGSICIHVECYEHGKSLRSERHDHLLAVIVLHSLLIGDNDNNVLVVKFFLLSHLLYSFNQESTDKFSARLPAHLLSVIPHILSIQKSL